MDGAEETPRLAYLRVQTADPPGDGGDARNHAAERHADEDGQEKPEDTFRKKFERSAEPDRQAEPRQKNRRDERYRIDRVHFTSEIEYLRRNRAYACAFYAALCLLPTWRGRIPAH